MAPARSPANWHWYARSNSFSARARSPTRQAYSHHAALAITPPPPLAYATMVLPLAYARTAIFDSTLTLCTTGAMLWFWDERPVTAWGALAIGALTKGPIALAIPLLALVAHALLIGTSVRRLFPWRGLAAFVAIVLPWFVAVAIRHPDFPHYAFVRETP